MSRRPDPGFWAGRRVLLTGHTGFKGAWAALWLARMGAEVTGFALPAEEGESLFALAGVVGRVRHIEGDLRDPEAVAQAVAAAQPQMVLHLAAQAILRRAVRDPVGTFETNVTGTARLLETLDASAPGVPCLVVTSDKVYRNEDRGRAFLESDPLGGKDPYSASKAACEILVASWRQSYPGRPLATVRGGNVIGGGDFAEARIVPDIYRAARAGEPVCLRHPEAVRPWQHVLDCLCGYFCFAEDLAAGTAPHALNIGPAPEPATTVAEACSHIGTALGAPPWVHEPDPASVEVRLLALDASAARQSLGWADRLDRSAALDWTAEWYARHLAGDDLAALTLAQIDRYGAGA